MRTILLLVGTVLLLSACGTAGRGLGWTDDGAIADPSFFHLVLSKEDIYPKRVGTVVISSLTRDIALEPILNSGAVPYLVMPAMALAKESTMEVELWVDRYFEGRHSVRIKVTSTGAPTPETLDLPFEDAGREPVPDDLPLEDLIITVENDPPPPPQPPDLPPSPYDLIGREILLSLTGAEGVTIFPRGFGQAVAGNDPAVVADQAVAAVAGAEGVAIVNLSTGNELGIVSTADRQYLAQCLWSPDDKKGALVAVGPEGVTLVPYDTDAGTWGTPTRLFDGENCTDVAPAGDDDTGVLEVLVVNHTGDYYIRIRLDALGTPEMVPNSLVPRSTFTAATGALVSACQPDPTGPVLTCTLGGDVWQESGGVGTHVSATGSQPRRIRACGDYAAVSSFGPGTGLGFGGVNICERDAAGTWSFAYGYSWSEGPLGLDCTQAANGNVLFATPNFNQAKYRINEVEAGTGNLLRDDISDAPTGVTRPGHVALVQRGALVISDNAGDTLHLVVSAP